MKSTISSKASSSLEFRRAITKVITTAIQTRTWENITMSQNKLKLNKQENCLRREKTQGTKESTYYVTLLQTK